MNVGLPGGHKNFVFFIDGGNGLRNRRAIDKSSGDHPAVQQFAFFGKGDQHVLVIHQSGSPVNDGIETLRFRQLEARYKLGHFVGFFRLIRQDVLCDHGLGERVVFGAEDEVGFVVEYDRQFYLGKFG